MMKVLVVLVSALNWASYIHTQDAMSSLFSSPQYDLTEGDILQTRAVRPPLDCPSLVEEPCTDPSLDILKRLTCLERDITRYIDSIEKLALEISSTSTSDEKLDAILHAVTGSIVKSKKKTRVGEDANNASLETVFEMVLKTLSTVDESKQETLDELENKIQQVIGGLQETQMNIQQSVAGLAQGARNIEKELLNAVLGLAAGARDIEAGLKGVLYELKSGAEGIETRLGISLEQLKAGARGIKEELYEAIEQLVVGARNIETRLIEVSGEQNRKLTEAITCILKKIKDFKLETRETNQQIFQGIDIINKHTDEQHAMLVDTCRQVASFYEDQLAEQDKKIDALVASIDEVKLSICDINAALVKFVAYFYRSMNISEEEL